MPDEGLEKLLSANLQLVHLTRKVPPITADGMLADEPSLTAEQLQHFGCTDCRQILRLQLSLLEVNL